MNMVPGLILLTASIFDSATRRDGIHSALINNFFTNPITTLHSNLLSELGVYRCQKVKPYIFIANHVFAQNVM